MSDTKLTDRHCQRETSLLDSTAVQALMTEVHADWSVSEDGQMIRRIFRFKNYYQTIAFVNALAWVAHRQDHHPDLEVGYNRCVVHYGTHSLGGLSGNDFICAAGIDALVPGDV
ncbi:MAG TPA: 4a-hydroxytetrahydrobiopterin dehydratase [Gammaproteobacteria bacterium]|nr:4a-hydroxytetrahydrobiopterin dehydratase [Gammaproteobacteria bacterium]